MDQVNGGVSRCTYRLVLHEDDVNCGHVIEFEGAGPEAVLSYAGQQCGSRTFHVFEDGRPLGLLRKSPSGYWSVSRIPISMRSIG